MRRRPPAHRVRAVGRHRPCDAFGSGVVFSDRTPAAPMLDAFSRWDGVEVRIRVGGDDDVHRLGGLGHAPDARPSALPRTDAGKPQRCGLHRRGC